MNGLRCIDLKRQFGRRYRVRCEEGKARISDPWLAVVECRHGHIYPHGGDQLGAATLRRGPVAKRLAALECTEVVADADDGVNVVFDIADFAAVAAVMKPRRRRVLSAEHRLKLHAASQRTRFSSGSDDAGEAQTGPKTARRGNRPLKPRK